MTTQPIYERIYFYNWSNFLKEVHKKSIKLTATVNAINKMKYYSKRRTKRKKFYTVSRDGIRL